MDIGIFLCIVYYFCRPLYGGSFVIRQLANHRRSSHLFLTSESCKDWPNFANGISDSTHIAICFNHDIFFLGNSISITWKGSWYRNRIKKGISVLSRYYRPSLDHVEFEIFLCTVLHHQVMNTFHQSSHELNRQTYYSVISQGSRSLQDSRTVSSVYPMKASEKNK